jgi:hypothetical protein
MSIFEQSADRGSYVDEYTALKEIGLAAGKALICVAGIVLALSTSVPYTFIGVFVIAACASGASVFLTHRVTRV